MHLRPTDALLVIDMQLDFLPGGALAVSGGDAILPGINALAARFHHVLLTQDWHPRHHISFASSHPGKQPFTDTIEAPYGTQHLWPDHCIQGTPGAELHPNLRIPHVELILRNGFRKDIDSYSAFTSGCINFASPCHASRGDSIIFTMAILSSHCNSILCRK